MGAPQPQFIPEAFSVNADPSRRNVIPINGPTAQRAGWSLGFPPQTMTPVVAGGKPMLGPDMNGVLYMLSTHTIYQQSGQPYRWNAAVAAAIGGYASGTILGSTDGVTVWFNILAGNTSDPDAGGAGWVPMYSYGITLLPPAAGGTVVLSQAQAAKGIIVISGALAGNLQVVVPNSQQRWLIVNTTTGAFTTTVKTAAGSGVAIPQGGFTGPTEVYGDGTNIYPVVAPITLPTDVAPTPNTIALRSNNGYLYATYLNQSSPLENFTISEVFAGVGDGFLRKINRANFAANFALSQFAGAAADIQVPASAVSQYFSLTGNVNGWTLRLPGGAMVQGGTVTYPGGGSPFPSGIMAFPTPWPNGLLGGPVANANTNVAGQPVNIIGDLPIIVFDSFTLATCRWRMDSNKGDGLGVVPFRWIALGY